jgi:hypothetical protein
MRRSLEERDPEGIVVKVDPSFWGCWRNLHSGVPLQVKITQGGDGSRGRGRRVSLVSGTNHGLSLSNPQCNSPLCDPSNTRDKTNLGFCWDCTLPVLEGILEEMIPGLDSVWGSYGSTPQSSSLAKVRPLDSFESLQIFVEFIDHFPPPDPHASASSSNVATAAAAAATVPPWNYGTKDIAMTAVLPLRSHPDPALRAEMELKRMFTNEEAGRCFGLRQSRPDWLLDMMQSRCKPLGKVVLGTVQCLIFPSCHAHRIVTPLCRQSIDQETPPQKGSSSGGRTLVLTVVDPYQRISRRRRFHPLR